MHLAEQILTRMPGIRKNRKKFLAILFRTVLALSGRVNFANLSRYSCLCEKTYSRNFRREFDFTGFNALAIEYVYDPSHTYVLAGDTTHIPKSGEKTYGIGKFWNAQQEAPTPGLQLSNWALVDVTSKRAYTLKADQLPPYEDENNQIEFFLSQLESLSLKRLPFSLPGHLAVDGYYAKARFVNGALALNYHIISKLRKDANLKYLHQPGSTPKKRGRPRIYAGKFDPQSPDFSRLTFEGEIDKHIRLYSAVVYCVFLHRKIKLVYVQYRKGKRRGYVLLFSTDLTLSAQFIYRAYTARFQIEFIFRDAKQFTGLTHCQARCKESLHFHFNMSLSVLNLVRIEHQLQLHKNPQTDSTGFSMASWKRRYANELFLEQIFSKLGLDPNMEKIQPLYQELRNFGVIAA